MKHVESFGSLFLYQKAIFLVYRNKWNWRKCANLINNVRRDLHPWQVVDPVNQRKEANKYAVKALRDTKLPTKVKEALVEGMKAEFNFKFDA